MKKRLGRVDAMSILVLMTLVALCASAVAQENTAESWYKKGQDLVANQSYDEAIQAYDQALKIDPNYGDAWRDRGYTLTTLASLNGDLNKYNQSIQSFDKAIELIPANDTTSLALSWEGKALALTSRGNALADLAHSSRSEAIQCYDKAIELDKSFTGLEAQLYRAGVLSDLGMYNESVAAYNKIIETMPANDTQYTSMVWAGKGSVLEKIGMKEDALKEFDKAIELDPTNAIAWAGKGKALKSLGRNSEADTAFAKAKELGITNLS